MEVFFPAVFIPLWISGIRRSIPSFLLLILLSYLTKLFFYIYIFFFGFYVYVQPFEL